MRAIAWNEERRRPPPRRRSALPRVSEDQSDRSISPSHCAGLFCPATHANMNRERWSALLDAATYAALTVLVWGANAFRRGLWQDDVQALGEAFRRLTHSFRVLFSPD